ncbi:unnamed protein product [Effrenium voratum]|nr:unnamed protein product [Effrenium voratum]
MINDPVLFSAKFPPPVTLQLRSPRLTRQPQRQLWNAAAPLAFAAAVSARPSVRRLTSRVAMFWQRPLAGKELPEPLRATDGLVAAAPPEDVFTQDTVTKRMPKILDSVMAKLPSKFQTPAVTEGVKKLQEEMRGGAQLKLLEGRSARVGAEAWNEHLADFLARGEGWHQAPWWLVENYMYKRLLEEGSSLGHVRLSCCFVCAVCCVVHVGCAVVCVRGPCVMLHWVGYIS